jgi:hypothetical protein
MDSRRIKAWVIHEWIRNTLDRQERKVNTTQAGGQKPVFMKFDDGHSVAELLQYAGAEVIYEQNSGILSHGKLYRAGLGIRKFRSAKLLGYCSPCKALEALVTKRDLDHLSISTADRTT